MIETTNQTISYGHVLARQLRSAVAQIPEDRRQLVLDRIQDRVAANRLTGRGCNDRVLAYTTDLLCDRCPSQPLGKKRRLK